MLKEDMNKLSWYCTKVVVTIRWYRFLRMCTVREKPIFLLQSSHTSSNKKPTVNVIDIFQRNIKQPLTSLRPLVELSNYCKLFTFISSKITSWIR